MASRVPGYLTSSQNHGSAAAVAEAEGSHRAQDRGAEEAGVDHQCQMAEGVGAPEGHWTMGEEAAEARLMMGAAAEAARVTRGGEAEVVRLMTVTGVVAAVAMAGRLSSAS